MRLIGERGLAMLDAPAGQADPERTLVREDLVRPFVARPDRNQDPAGHVGLVDRQGVVRDQIRERIGDPVEQGVEALLAEDVVEDVRQPTVGLDQRTVAGRRFLGLRDEPQR